MNILLDTCVLIDYLGKKPPFFDDAERVVAAGYFNDAKLWVSVQSLKDAFYVLSKYVGSHAAQRAIEAACEVIAPVDTTASDALRALRLQWADYEECMVSVCAAKAGADYLVTRDVRGFERSSVPAITPADWLAQMHDAGMVYESVGL